MLKKSKLLEELAKFWIEELKKYGHIKYEPDEFDLLSIVIRLFEEKEEIRKAAKEVLLNHDLCEPEIAQVLPWYNGIVVGVLVSNYRLEVVDGKIQFPKAGTKELLPNPSVWEAFD